MTDLEKQLKKLPLRAVPPDLRRIVLAASEEKEEAAASPSFCLWRILYPGHRLTAGLAFLWLMVIFLRLDTPENPSPTGPALSLTQWKAAKQERDLLIARMESSRFEINFDTGSFSIPMDDLKTN